MFDNNLKQRDLKSLGRGSFTLNSFKTSLKHVKEECFNQNPNISNEVNKNQQIEEGILPVNNQTNLDDNLDKIANENPKIISKKSNYKFSFEFKSVRIMDEDAAVSAPKGKKE